MRRILVLLLACGYFPSFPSVFAEQPETIQFLNSGKISSTNLPFSEAVRVDNMLYLSGQIGIAPGTRKLVTGALKKRLARLWRTSGAPSRPKALQCATS